MRDQAPACTHHLHHTHGTVNLAHACMDVWPSRPPQTLDKHTSVRPSPLSPHTRSHTVPLLTLPQTLDKHTNLATSLLAAIKARGLDGWHTTGEDVLCGKVRGGCLWGFAGGVR